MSGASSFSSLRAVSYDKSFASTSWKRKLRLLRASKICCSVEGGAAGPRRGSSSSASRRSMPVGFRGVSGMAPALGFVQLEIKQGRISSILPLKLLQNLFQLKALRYHLDCGHRGDQGIVC